MSESLKDQLLALGLARKKGKPGSSTKKRPGSQETSKRAQDISLDQAWKMRTSEERRQREQAQQRKREQERLRRQTNQRIMQLVKEHAVRDEAADCKRNFLYKGRIRSVLATRQQIDEINKGSLGVVYLSGGYHLLPAEILEEIRQFAADHIPDLGGSESADEDEHPVPDDLIW